MLNNFFEAKKKQSSTFFSKKKTQTWVGAQVYTMTTARRNTQTKIGVVMIAVIMMAVIMIAVIMIAVIIFNFRGIAMSSAVFF